MSESEGANADMMQRLQSSFGASSSSFLKQTLSMDQLTIPQFTPSQQMRAATTTRTPHHSYGGDGNRRAGIPPSHPHQIPPISPYSQIPPPSSSSSSSRTLHHQAGSPTPTHTRSLSQPSFFSLDSLPPLSPSPFRDSSTSISDSADVSMEDRDVTSHHSLLPPSSPFSAAAAAAAARGGSNSNLPPPRKSHRRSSSDIPFGFSNVINSSPPLIPLRGAPNASQMIKKEDAEGSGEKKFSPEGEVVDDLFSAYMNLDNINDALNNNNSSDEKNGTENNDLDSRASGTKTNNTGGGGDSSDNEAESSVNEQEGGGVKRSAGGDVVAVAAAAMSSGSRHYRSVSMDSFIGKLSFSDHESLLSLPPSKMIMMPPSSPGSSRPAGGGGGLVSSPSSNGVDGNSSGFSLEFGNGEFSGPELKKIMANEKLAEIAVSDPKRAKRILANRQSAARSKERKMRYISELEHKVQTLQTEATTLSAQLTLLQRDSVGLTNQNSELKFRLQSMEQQAKLRDALNEALTAEVQRLKLATAELNGESHPSSCLIPQHSVNPLMFQQQPPTASQQNIHLQQQQQLHHQPQQQSGNANSQTDLKQ